MKAKYSVVMLCLIFVAFLISCKNNEVSLYVSPDGDDLNEGTISAPLKSLEKAQEKVLELSSDKQEAVTVYLRGGEYSLEHALIFESLNSGTITIKAYGGEIPIIEGGKKLVEWELLNEDQMLARLPESARGKVYITDVRKAGVTDLGDPIEIGKRPDLYYNHQLQTLARYPNKGFVESGKARGNTSVGANYAKRAGTVEGVFEYVGNYQSKWVEENEVCLHAYWFWDWSEEYQKVDRFDPSTKTVYLKEPYHTYGYRNNFRYSGLNLFCEMDSEGEWYLDRTTGLLYWYPPQGIDPSVENVVLSNFSSPYMVEVNNCTDVVLEGLVFQHGKGAAVVIKGGKSNKILNCRVERFGQDGLHINQGVAHIVSGCYLTTLGCSGINIFGGDRKTLTSSQHVVENTVIEHFSLFKKTYQPAIHMDGCGIRIANNRFSHSTSSAIRMEGNDHIIEYNQIYHVVNESDDQGGLDAYFNPSYRGNVIRYNHWFNIKGGTHHGSAGVRLDDMISGTLIYGNLFEECGVIHFGGVQIHGGKDNIVDNNVFYRCNVAVSFSNWGEGRWLRELDSPEVKKKLYEEVDINSPHYLEKYPELKDLRINIDVNTIKNNIVVDCGGLFKGINDVQITKNNVELKSEGEMAEVYCDSALLSKYGLHPIPFADMGPKNNKWFK